MSSGRLVAGSSAGECVVGANRASSRGLTADVDLAARLQAVFGTSLQRSKFLTRQAPYPHGSPPHSSLFASVLARPQFVDPVLTRSGWLRVRCTPFSGFSASIKHVSSKNLSRLRVDPRREGLPRSSFPHLRFSRHLASFLLLPLAPPFLRSQPTRSLSSHTVTTPRSLRLYVCTPPGHVRPASSLHASLTSRPVSTAPMSNPEIPKEGVAVVFDECNGPLRVDKHHHVVQPSELKPGEVLVKVEYTGVCRASARDRGRGARADSALLFSQTPTFTPGKGTGQRRPRPRSSADMKVPVMSSRSQTVRRRRSTSATPSASRCVGLCARPARYG